MFKPVNKNSNIDSIGLWCFWCDKGDYNCTFCDGGALDLWGG